MMESPPRIVVAMQVLATRGLDEETTKAANKVVREYLGSKED